ncbi:MULTISPECIES: hypothetical protein [Acinetobacter]|uniref:hypothetical protein n=1 Tax=Acinetobacter TaxID=469 RepID=UPI000B3CC6CB|nr:MULTISPECIES: hypothetical protein [Acinetobacter]AWA48161.1 hypothetical protein CDG57_09250 [Acinetobacter junii]MBL8280380.1 hypothetical protein [Acinetobacter junii]MDI6622543.1 hypothetical protein [Acinetobacter junii]MDU2408864.1 hypothetical protein [Acinetobacter junii]QQV66010.1 hypothetical protein ABCA12_1375 [Acinetobacter junii]
MSELKLKVFVVLDDILKKDLADNRAYDCLKVICSASIDALNTQNEELITYTRYQLKLILDGQQSVASMDSKDLGKWMSDKKLSAFLDRVITKHTKKFKEIGYIPVVKTNDTIGGKGNERRYWLDITEYAQTQNEEDQKLDENEISYERVDPSEIKLSWFYRFIFKKGEIRNKSLRGLMMLIVLLGGFISWALYVCAFSLVLVREGQNFTTLDLLFIACLIGFSYLSFKYWFTPLWNLPEHRVIKAPMTFISLNEDHADIEMYRDRERNQLTRITRFKGICPICSAEVVLRIGQPDHNLPLVGRCVESPFAHVYSFDRVLMSGKLLSR